MKRIRKTGVRRRRLLVVMGIVLVQLAGIASAHPAQAQTTPDKDDMERVTFELEPVVTEMRPSVGPGEGSAPQVIEPPPYCDIYSLIGGEIDAWYFQGHLEIVEARFWGGITCQQTAPHQEMLELRDHAQIASNFELIEPPAQEARCSHDHPEDLCLFVFSSGDYICTGGPACAGWWQGWNWMELIIDPAYRWNGWPETCDPIWPNDLLCYNYTDTTYVPPTFP